MKCLFFTLLIEKTKTKKHAFLESELSISRGNKWLTYNYTPITSNFFTFFENFPSCRFVEPDVNWRSTTASTLPPKQFKGFVLKWPQRKEKHWTKIKNDGQDQSDGPVVWWRQAMRTTGNDLKMTAPFFAIHKTEAALLIQPCKWDSCEWVFKSEK